MRFELTTLTCMRMLSDYCRNPGFYKDFGDFKDSMKNINIFTHIAVATFLNVDIELYLHKKWFFCFTSVF